MIKKIESVCASERERVRERMESKKKMESVFVRVRENGEWEKRRVGCGEFVCKCERKRECLCVRERDREE